MKFKKKKKKKTIQSYEEEKWETVNSAVSKYPKIQILE